MAGSNAVPDSIYDRLHNVAVVSSDITNNALPGYSSPAESQELWLSVW
jgi:hypothetical protein